MTVRENSKVSHQIITLKLITIVCDTKVIKSSGQLVPAYYQIVQYDGNVPILQLDAEEKRREGIRDTILKQLQSFCKERLPGNQDTSSCFCGLPKECPAYA